MLCLCFKIFVCFAKPCDTLLLWNLCFKIWIFSLFCFCEPHVTNNKIECSSLSVRLDWNEKLKLFYYSVYFCYYSWASLHFLVLFMCLTVLFQLTFTFIDNIFSKISWSQTNPKCPFGKDYFCQLILLFSLFLVLFMSPTALFGTIYGSHCSILVNFYLYLQYFQ